MSKTEDKPKSKLEQELKEAGAVKISSEKEIVDIDDTAGKLGELLKISDYDGKIIVINESRFNPKGKFGQEMILELDTGESVHVANTVIFEQLFRVKIYPIRCKVVKVKGTPNYYTLQSAKESEDTKS